MKGLVKLFQIVVFILIFPSLSSVSMLAQEDSDSVAAAGTKALEIVGGEAIGGSVSMLGVLGGAELDAFLNIFVPFEDATGIHVEYESTRDIAAVLQTRLEGGNPPDIASNPGVGQMIAYANEGRMIELSQFLPEDNLSNYDPVLLETVGADGKIFNIFTAVNLAGLIWYNPNTYTGPNPPQTWEELQAWATETAATGTTPWCIGLESGAASGWPGLNWINDLVMNQLDSESYNQWWRGELSWTSPEIRQAYEMLGEIALDPQMVESGSTAVLATNFLNGGDGIFAEPPSCYLHNQASFYGAIATGNFPDLVPIEDINFFAFPSIDPAYANVRQVSGEVMGMFNDTPQSRALIQYFASTEAQTLMAETGIWLSASRAIPIEAYPSPFTQRAAEILSNAQTVYYNASGLMPQEMNAAFLSSILEYIQAPETLDTILTNLDSVREAAYR
ncbi:MAG: ABC transporter substrate-binding protein [Chloroflexi bacterium]|nr:ABC transporter substrate-binding protein [Chloroflexota bacterium]